MSTAGHSTLVSTFYIDVAGIFAAGCTHRRGFGILEWVGYKPEYGVKKPLLINFFGSSLAWKWYILVNFFCKMRVRAGR